MSNSNLMEISDESQRILEEEVEKAPTDKTTTSAASASTVSVSGPVEKRARSEFWGHFDTIIDDDEHVECKYCGKIIQASKKKGTSGLKNHLHRCKKYPPNLSAKKQKVTGFERSPTQVAWHFDQEAARKGCARMLILDELPFSHVEREGFRDFCKLLQPEFVPPSRRIVTRDCYDLYVDEVKKMKSFLCNLSSRVSLTTDTWTSGQNLSYMCLTVHFIDDDWNLRKRILNFCPISGHSGELIGKAVEKCLIEWGIKKVMTITVDNASSNDLAIRYLQRRLNHWGGSVLDSKYLHMRCAAHILNLVVKDGLKDLDVSILRIRVAVRHVRSSPARLKKFKCCVEEEKIECRSLVCLDVETRWNSTYLMLETAIKFRKAFDNLQSKGGAFVKEFEKIGGPPSDEDWNKVGCLLPFLRTFYEATLKFSGSNYVTGNTYVPQLCGIGDMISTLCESEDVGMKGMAKQMKAKLDKYWGNFENVNVLIFVAFVLDPRHNLEYVTFVVENFYGEENGRVLMSKIKNTLRSLFDEYSACLKKPMGDPNQLSSSSLSHSSLSDPVAGVDYQLRLKLKYKMKMGTLDTIERKTELDKYLNEECENDDDGFDILQWWKNNQNRYPVLSMIARDVLAIPVSTVASESAFSTGGRVLDSFRTSLTPRMVEALVCCQDWKRTSMTPIAIEENILELEELEKGMNDLILEQPVIEIDE